jgi:hypothetical protein
MTKHKLRKIAKNQNLTLRQLFILAILKTLVISSQVKGDRVRKDYTKYKSIKQVISIAKTLKIRSKHLSEFKAINSELKKQIEE